MHSPMAGQEQRVDQREMGGCTRNTGDWMRNRWLNEMGETTRTAGQRVIIHTRHIQYLP